MKQNRPLTILFVLSFLIALLTFDDYGESWDEMKLYRYADNSLEAYVTWPEHGTIPVTGDRFENYGPAFLMGTRIITKAVTRLAPAIQAVDVQHFIYFLMFLLGIWAFYQLAVRWMSRNAAFGATLLFMTQPVFWGHAFINPKDIPLLSLFLLTVYLGIRMHDTIFEGATDTPPVNTWKEADPRTRRQLVVATAIWLAFLLVFFGGAPLIQQWIDSAVRAAASGEPTLLSLLTPRIQRVAPEIYIEKFFVLFLRLRMISFLIITSIILWFYRRHLPVALRTLGIILPAGILLGLAISIRIFGAWAGVLVAGYILWKSGRKSWLLLSVYALCAIFAMYLTWPYLWADPIGRFVETIVIMTRHPWPSSVLFNGAYYPANDLPGSYVPLLLAIQLTEPVWVLFCAGLAVTIYGWVKKRLEQRELLVLTLAWFVVPLLAFIILRPTLYDNFRQSFFIIPPIFFMTGLAFDLLKKPILQSALIALVLVPGLVAYARLHPYEYVYYNQFIGGVDAAVDRFELEYWATSYREAAAEVDRIAPPNANVWVDGPAHLFHGRDDLHVYSAQIDERAEHYDVVVTLIRYDWEESSFPDAQIVYRVGREGAVFAILRMP